MNLKEICSKELPDIDEIFFIADMSYHGSLEDLNIIVDFCCNNKRINPLGEAILLRNVKYNKVCDEELFLKIKAIYKVNELERYLP
jgi:hypothetical protein